MSIAILATGDEIINGDTLNTTSQALAQALSSEGLSVGMMLACGDSQDVIHSCLEFLTQKHDLIILTGGLGPTSDDRTRFALARFLNLQLVEQQEAFDHIQRLLCRTSLKLNAGNRQQALFPRGARLLPNPFGTAMGASISCKDKQYILLPGPPRECLPMFDACVLPDLTKVKKDGNILLKWRVFGVAESEIGQTLDQALEGVDCETGYRLEVPYIEFKVRCQPAQIARVKKIIDPLVAPYIISPPEQRASTQLIERLTALGASIEIIDDATGGRLQAALQRPGNHNLVTFHEHHSAALHFHITGLEAYWGGQQASSSDMTIHYRAGKQQGREQHNIPYRSALVLDYATEWLSFRLLHLINQLHQGIA